MRGERQRGVIERRAKGNYSVRYWDRTGRRRRRSGFRTQREAQEWLTERLRRLRSDPVSPDVTVADMIHEFLELHSASAARMESLKYHLASAEVELGQVRLIELTKRELQAWHNGIELPHARWSAMQAMKQALNEAVEWGWLRSSPAKGIRNPMPNPPDVRPFRDWSEVDALAEAIGPHYRPLVVFAVATGLRPQEWRKLRWKHVHDDVLVLPKDVVKASTPPRRVPLSERAQAAVSEMTRGDDEELVFRTPAGKPVDLRNWRPRHWQPALDAAGLERRAPKDMRHTFATWAIAAGVPTHDLARYMGTSMAMIDRTYGHLSFDADDRLRAALQRAGRPAA